MVLTGRTIYILVTFNFISIPKSNLGTQVIWSHQCLSYMYMVYNQLVISTLVIPKGNNCYSSSFT